MSDSPIYEFLVLNEERSPSVAESMTAAFDLARAFVTIGQDKVCYVYQLVARVDRTCEVVELGPGMKPLPKPWSKCPGSK